MNSYAIALNRLVQLRKTDGIRRTLIEHSVKDPKDKQSNYREKIVSNQFDVLV